MATIQTLNGTEKIKDSYGKINTSLTNLNNSKMEKTADSDLNMNGFSVTNINNIHLRSPTILTISGDAITVTQSFHLIDTEGEAASDDLSTINGGASGDLLFLRTVSNLRTVTIRHNVGNIRTLDGSDVVLNSINGVALFIRSGPNWMYVGIPGVKRAGDTMTGILSIKTGYPSLILEDTNVDGVLAALTGYSGRLSIRLGGNSSANEVLGVMTDGLLFPPNGRRIVIGTGSPQGVVTAPAGSIYLNTSGGASTTIWVKESGTGNTGWVAK